MGPQPLVDHVHDVVVARPAGRRSSCTRFAVVSASQSSRASQSRSGCSQARESRRCDTGLPEAAATLAKWAAQVARPWQSEQIGRAPARGRARESPIACAWASPQAVAARQHQQSSKWARARWKAWRRRNGSRVRKHNHGLCIPHSCPAERAANLPTGRFSPAVRTSRAQRTWTRGRMALSATRGLRCKPSSTSRPSLGPSLQPWPPDGQHTHRGLADVHEATATTPPGSADTYPVPHDPLAQKVPNYGAVPREAAPLLLKDITEDVSTCASAVRRVTCGCPVM